MARGNKIMLQIKKRSAGKTLRVFLSAVILTGSLGLSGCSPSLSQAYSFSDRIPALEASFSERGEYSDGFAADLCALDSEDDFDPAFADSEAAVLFDLSGREVLYSKNAFEKLYPASITKVMTALIAIKYGNLSDSVTVTEDAVITEAGATLCGINPGDTLTLEQLLYGLLLPSGNDAGAAIAVHMAGSTEAFADMMNEEAAGLGATGTHFVNPHGLNDAEHYTTAYDLYLIFNEALKYPVFRQITGSTAYTANYRNRTGETVSKTWKGGNWFMTGEQETPEGLTVFGGKTGTTKAAGYCLIMASKDDSDREYISVVLKADSRQGLYDNMTNIISKIVK
ncbi:MAG: D-alanyl-D-alanine carboxypeptidase family protein [Enterocloster sp.]